MFMKSRISAGVPELIVAFLVFSLSIGVVGGILLYLDSAGPDVLSEMSEEVSVDLEVYFHSDYYQQNETTINSLRDVVLEQEYISKAEVVSILEVNDADVSVPEYSRSMILGIEDTFETSLPKGIEVSDSSYELNGSNCYLLRSRLLNDGLEIGDNFTISVPLDSIRVNRTYTIAGTFESNLFMRRLKWNKPEFPCLFVVMQRDTLRANFSEISYSGESNLVDRIWVSFDTNQLISKDPSNIVSSLRRIEKQIEQRTLPFASVVQFRLISVFYEYSTWTTSMRIVSLAFSIPSLIMGFMLIQCNARLQHDEQRKNVGTLKTRGATGSQTVKWVLSMSLFTGAVGSIGAVLTGVMASILAGSVQELMIFDLTKLQTFKVVFIPQTIIIVFLFSFVAGFLVTIPSVISTYMMTAADAHQIIENDGGFKDETLSNPIYQVAITGISGLILLSLLRSLQSFTDFSAFMGIAVIIFLALFILGCTLLISGPSTRLKSEILLRIKKKSYIVGTRILGKATKSYRRSESLVIVFISLVFIAGIFSALAATSGADHMKGLFIFYEGADVVIDVKPGLNNVTSDMIDRFLEVEGVQSASAMMITAAQVTFNMEWNGNIYLFNSSMPIIGIQPQEWIQSAFLKPYFTYYHNPIYSILKLEESENNVITSFKPIIGYSIDNFGNSVPTLIENIGVELIGPEEKHNLNCTIIDVMADDPASITPSLYLTTSFSGRSYLPGFESLEQFVMFDIDVLHNYLNSSEVNKFYIKLESGADYVQVMENLGACAPNSFEKISSPYSEIDAVLDTRAGQTIYGAYSLNVIFSMLYLSAGVTLLVTMKINKMRKHYSLLRALGTQTNTITITVLFDSTITILLGALSGIVIGVILTLIVFQMPLTYLGLASTVVWDRLPLTISIPIQLMSTIIFVAISFSLLATYFVIHRSLQTNIAEDIQHSE